ncbi:hypothetical protein H2203_001551 [Taxawa tesnikishii (nom. ined.)]|nr:hypothetical protein H2203_001551 [Dothideales sp. JES 119]
MAPAKVRMSSTKVIDAGQTSPESHHSRTSINADQKDEDDLVVRASDPRQVNGPDNTRQENEDNSLVEDSYKLPYHAKNHTERIEAPADINDASGGHTMSSDNRQSQTRQDTHGTGVSLEAIEAASAPRQSTAGSTVQDAHTVSVASGTARSKPGQLPKVASAKTRIQKPKSQEDTYSIHTSPSQGRKGAKQPPEPKNAKATAQRSKPNSKATPASSKTSVRTRKKVIDDDEEYNPASKTKSAPNKRKTRVAAAREAGEAEKAVVASKSNSNTGQDDAYESASAARERLEYHTTDAFDFQRSDVDAQQAAARPGGSQQHAIVVSEDVVSDLEAFVSFKEGVPAQVNDIFMPNGNKEPYTPYPSSPPFSRTGTDNAAAGDELFDERSARKSTIVNWTKDGPRNQGTEPAAPFFPPLKQPRPKQERPQRVQLEFQPAVPTYGDASEQLELLLHGARPDVHFHQQHDEDGDVLGADAVAIADPNVSPPSKSFAATGFSSNTKTRPAPPELDSQAITEFAAVKQFVDDTDSQPIVGVPETDPFVAIDQGEDAAHGPRKITGLIRVLNPYNNEPELSAASPRKQQARLPRTYQPQKSSSKEPQSVPWTDRSGEDNSQEEGVDPDRTLVDETDLVRDGYYPTSSDSDSEAEPSETDPEDARAIWRASLQPHQASLFDALVGVAHRIVRHVVDQETAMADIVSDYYMEGRRLTEATEGAWHESIDNYIAGVNEGKRSLFERLQGVSATVTECRKAIESSKKFAKAWQDGSKKHVEEMLQRYG